MSISSKEFSQLKNKWKKNWKDEVADIFLFGSALKGKSNPNDIDICFVFKDKINLSIIKEAELLLSDKFHLSSLLAEDFIKEVHSLSRTILLEGKSLLSGKKMAENYKLTPRLLYCYDLSTEPASKKVRFVNLMRGRRGEEGIVARNLGEFISSSAFLMPIEKDKEIQEILDFWKIKYTRRKLLLMG